MSRNTPGILAAALLLAAPAAAEEFRWSGSLSPGQTVEVEGVNGDVEVTRAAGAEVELVAEKRGRRDDPAEVRIEVVEHAGGVTFCAIYPDGRRPNRCLPGEAGHLGAHDNDVVVDFRLRVPAGLAVAASTVNGDVDASGLDAGVDARTVNGGIRVSTAGVARARTVNGSIDAALGRGDWSDPVRFETVNGSIRVELPAATGADVRARTVNGDIDTDFPLTVSGRFSGKRLSGTIGGGGGELELETVNGGIRLRRR